MQLVPAAVPVPCVNANEPLDVIVVNVIETVVHVVDEKLLIVEPICVPA